MAGIGDFPMPIDFPYRDVFLQGRPRHPKMDPFWIRHPPMDPGRRAKIFAPFDALRGFNAAILARTAEENAGGYLSGGEAECPDNAAPNRQKEEV